MMGQWMLGFVMGVAMISMAAAPSWAQEGDSVVQEDDKVSYKKKTVIDFSDVTIQGELTKPVGSYLLQRRRTIFRTLLKVRGDFLPELFNSTDNL